VSPLSTVELVSQGERLCEVADELERAETPTLRDLRLYSTVAALRPLETAVGDQVPASLGAFAGAARELIAQGGVARNPEEFADCVRQAGGALRGIGSATGNHRTSELIESLSQRLHKMGAPVFRPVYPTPVPAVERPVEPEVPAAGSAVVVVAIETLLVEDLRPASRPVPMAQPAADEPGLVGSFVTFSRLLAERGLGAASLEELLAGPAAPADDGDVMDIGLLCYCGRGARERAGAVRQELDGVLASNQFSRLRPLIDELVDLVSLAAEPS
jgi:hypothetical protein